MRKLLYILIVLPVLAKSQIWQDSLFINSQKANVYSIGLLRHGLNDSIGSYGRVGLYYDHSSGNYRRAQQAFSKSSVSFQAEGSSRINKFSISGDFTFDKIFEDSLSNSLRSDLDPLSPFYHYASKGNKYERQNYIANTTISYDLIPRILSPFLHVNYRTHWTTGSIDPRPGVKKFVLKYNPGLTYRTKKGGTFGLMAIVGHSDEKVSINFKNKGYEQSTTFPERISYINFGYGYSSIKDSLYLSKFTAYKGAEFTIKDALGNWNLLSFVRYERSVEESTHTAKTSPRYSIRGKFLLNQYSGRLLFTKIGDQHDQQLDIEAQIFDGYDGHIDFSSDLSVVNYEVSQNTARIAYSLIFNKQQRTEHELGLTLNYYQEKRSDAAQSTGLSARQLSIAPLYRSYIDVSDNSMLIAKVAPFYNFPVQAEVVTNPNSVNTFTRNVVYTDYYYFDSKLAGASLGVSWLSNNLLRKNIIEFGIDFHYLKKLNAPDITYEAGFVPDKSRSYSNASVKLFF